MTLPHPLYPGTVHDPWDGTAPFPPDGLPLRGEGSWANIWHRLEGSLDPDDRVTRVLVAELCHVRAAIAESRLEGRAPDVEDVDALTDLLGALIGL